MSNLWTIPPDWTNGVTENLEWLTNIMQSQAGAEQRQARRLSPRRTVEYDFLCEGRYRTLFDLMTVNGGSAEWLLPLWWDGAGMTAAFNAGSPAIAIPTTNTEFANATQVLIYKNAFVWELMTIAAMSATTLSFLEVTSRSWPKGSRVYPVRPATLTDQPSISKLTSKVAQGTIRFRTTENNPLTAAIGSTWSFNSHPVLLDNPNERDGVTLSYERLISDFDGQSGPIVRTDTANIGFMHQNHPTMMVGKAEHMAFRQRLYALQGMLNVVYLSTFGDDLELAAPTRGGTLTVKACGYSLYGTTTGRKDIVIELRNGQKFFATISHGNAVNDDLETLTINVADFGVQLVPALVLRISFIYLARLDSDGIDIVHQTDNDGVAESVLSFRSTPEIRNVV